MTQEEKAEYNLELNLTLSITNTLFVNILYINQSSLQCQYLD